MRVPEAVVRHTPERAAPPDRRLHVERHLVPLPGRRAYEGRLKREYPLLVKERDELLEEQIQRAEAVAIEIPVAILPQPYPVAAAGLGVPRLVPVVDIRERFSVGIGRLLEDPRGGTLVETCLEGRESRIGARPD